MAFIGKDYKVRASRYQKEAKDFQRQKDLLDVYDTYYGTFRDHKQIETWEINYDLMNGRLDANLYSEPIKFKLGAEEITLDHQNITHYPLISQIARAFHGEAILRPFNPTVKHHGAKAGTMRDKEWSARISQLLADNIIAPIRQQVTQQYLASNGITDLYALQPEQLLQVEADVNRRVMQSTPKDVVDFMNNKFQTPTEVHANELLRSIMGDFDIDWMQGEGFKHMIPTGREVVFCGERRDELLIKLCNPKYFTSGGSQNQEWFQDREWAKYEEWITFGKAMQDHADIIDSKTYEELLDLGEPIGGHKNIGDPRKDRVQRHLMFEVGVEGSEIQRKSSGLDIRNSDGQRRIKQLYADIAKQYGHDNGDYFGYYGIRRAHIVFRDKRHLKRVTRNVSGELKKFWLDEHYEPKPSDIEIKDYWVDEVWEGYKLGEDHHVGIRPVPYQYKSIYNPFKVDLPYYGIDYNTFMGNSRNVAFPDLGKAWQKEFDVTMANIKHDMATELGQVFVMAMGLKPQNMKWQEWMDTIKSGSILAADTQQRAYSSLDPQLIRGLDLSKASSIANKIQYLEVIKQNLLQAMNFTPGRIGQVGQYTTQANLQIQQSASYNQTESYFQTHNKLWEKILQSAINKKRYILRHKDFEARQVLSDTSLAEMTMMDDFWFDELKVKISLSSEDVAAVERLKQQVQALIQNSYGFDAIVELSMAETQEEILNIARRETEKVRQMTQSQSKAEQEMEQAKREHESQQAQLDREWSFREKKLQVDSNERAAILRAEQFSRQFDINENKESDLIESKQIEMEQREKERLDDKEIKERELEIKNKEANAKLINGKKSP